MVDGRQLKKAIDKFMQSPVCLDARVQMCAWTLEYK